MSTKRADLYKTPEHKLVPHQGGAKKNERITIRINAEDLEQIKQKAAQTGMPYQTLITTLLHQYLSGKVMVEL